jgi:hypothetical protein
MPSQIQAKREVHKITKWRNNQVIATEVVCEIWIDYGLTPEQERAIAKEHGGDFLTVCPQVRPYDELYRTLLI